MSSYRNFAIELPSRLRKLDDCFREAAQGQGSEVSYLLMKLAALFLLPYQRLVGDSGAAAAEVSPRAAVRKYLELDKRFRESRYCLSIDAWCRIDTLKFSEGPRAWADRAESLDEMTHWVLLTIRNALAHSNLHFGGENEIRHIYFGKREDRDPGSDRYVVIGCDVASLERLVTAWLDNVEAVAATSRTIWGEVERAA